MQILIGYGMPGQGSHSVDEFVTESSIDDRIRLSLGLMLGLL